MVGLPAVRFRGAGSLQEGAEAGEAESTVLVRKEDVGRVLVVKLPAKGDGVTAYAPRGIVLHLADLNKYVPGGSRTRGRQR